jgi:hypothetical protein
MDGLFSRRTPPKPVKGHDRFPAFPFVLVLLPLLHDLPEARIDEEQELGGDAEACAGRRM